MFKIFLQVCSISSSEICVSCFIFFLLYKLCIVSFLHSMHLIWFSLRRTYVRLFVGVFFKDILSLETIFFVLPLAIGHFTK